MSQDGFSEKTCSVLTTLNEEARTVTFVMGDDAAGASFPDGIRREDGQLVVDLALVPALAQPSHAVWVAEAEVIVVHRDEGVGYLAFRSDCPNHQSGGESGADIFESDSPAPALNQCPSFQMGAGGDGAPAGHDDPDLQQLPLTRDGSMLRIMLDS